MKKDKKEKRSNIKDVVLAALFVSTMMLAMLSGTLLMRNHDYKEKLNKALEEVKAPVETAAEEETATAEETTTEEETTAVKKKDYNDQYSRGAIWGQRIIQLYDDITQLYMSDDITDEQMAQYVEAYLNIANSALKNGEVTVEQIEKYNNIIKEIPFIDYDYYQLASTGENFRKGLSGWLKANTYYAIMDRYQEQIPEEKYNTFKVVVRQNIYGYEEENCERIIDYGKKLIEDYVGDPDEILASVKFKGMPEK